MFGNDSITQDSSAKSDDNGASNDSGTATEPISPPSVSPTEAPTTPTNPIHSDDNAQNADDKNQNPASLFTTKPVVDPFGTTAPEHHKDEDDSKDSADTPQDQLINIKQQALQHLSPLVDHLDQSPEEKFKTTMMMIQASDDQKLIPNAFETAKLIEDDKFRAQAMLDIVNEINYFTQHNQ